MCTAIWDKNSGLLGRTLDLEYTYAEQVTVSPGRLFGGWYGMVGVATIAEGYPLYYDAINEKGVAMAALHFPRSCVYPPPREGAVNVGSYALIPTLLSRCPSVTEAVAEMRRIYLCNRAFSTAYPAAPLHWILADGQRAVVIEATAAGVQVYDNPAGVLTNEPPLPHQLTHLSHYAHLTPHPPTGKWQSPVSRGGGGVGMPGDDTSPSRFVRAAFIATHAPANEEQPITAFFNRMAAIAIPRGRVLAEDGRWVETHYTCCMDLTQGVYYYRTAGCHRLRAVNLHPAPAGGGVITYPLYRGEDVHWENEPPPACIE